MSASLNPPGTSSDGIIIRVVAGNYAMLVQLLSQTGYELQPRSPTLWVDYYLFYPNPFRLIVAIVHKRGFLAPFCGVFERIATELLSKAIQDTVGVKLMSMEMKTLKKRLPEMGLFWWHVAKFTVTRLLATALCQPLRVVTVRKMLQVVSGQGWYHNPVWVARDIYRQEGWLGFLSGLAPTLMYVLVNCSVMAVIHCCRHRDDRNTLAAVHVTPLTMFSVYCAYPLLTVATVMTAGSAGLPPGQAPYKTWVHCLWDLARQKRLFRGVYAI